jgi:hypothetical protein
VTPLLAPAVGILHRRKLAAVPPEERDALHAQLAEDHEPLAGGVLNALAPVATVTGVSFTDKGLLNKATYPNSVRSTGVTTPKITVTIR